MQAIAELSGEDGKGKNFDAKLTLLRQYADKLQENIRILDQEDHPLRRAGISTQELAEATNACTKAQDFVKSHLTKESPSVVNELQKFMEKAAKVVGKIPCADADEASFMKMLNTRGTGTAALAALQSQLKASLEKVEDVLPGLEEATETQKHIEIGQQLSAKLEFNVAVFAVLSILRGGDLVGPQRKAMIRHLTDATDYFTEAFPCPPKLKEEVDVALAQGKKPVARTKKVPTAELASKRPRSKASGAQQEDIE